VAVEQVHMAVIQAEMEDVVVELVVSLALYNLEEMVTHPALLQVKEMMEEIMVVALEKVEEVEEDQEQLVKLHRLIHKQVQVEQEQPLQ
tara:strand:+ start:46 stop:312 length:267 start_codon:yes stop_codon:yes gene_type:complete